MTWKARPREQNVSLSAWPRRAFAPGVAVALPGSARSTKGLFRHPAAATLPCIRSSLIPPWTRPTRPCSACADPCTLPSFGAGERAAAWEVSCLVLNHVLRDKARLMASAGYVRTCQNLLTARCPLSQVLQALSLRDELFQCGRLSPSA